MWNVLIGLTPAYQTDILPHWGHGRLVNPVNCSKSVQFLPELSLQIRKMLFMILIMSLLKIKRSFILLPFCLHRRFICDDPKVGFISECQFTISLEISNDRFHCKYTHCTYCSMGSSGNTNHKQLSLNVVSAIKYIITWFFYILFPYSRYRPLSVVDGHSRSLEYLGRWESLPVNGGLSVSLTVFHGR